MWWDSSILHEGEFKRQHTHMHTPTAPHTHKDVAVCSIEQDELRVDLECVISIKRKQGYVHVGLAHCIKLCFIKIMPCIALSLSFSLLLSLSFSPSQAIPLSGCEDMLEV